jgi:hypothetical protein
MPRPGRLRARDPTCGRGGAGRAGPSAAGPRRSGRRVARRQRWLRLTCAGHRARHGGGGRGELGARAGAPGRDGRRHPVLGRPGPRRARRRDRHALRDGLEPAAGRVRRARHADRPAGARIGAAPWAGLARGLRARPARRAARRLSRRGCAGGLPVPHPGAGGPRVHGRSEGAAHPRQLPARERHVRLGRGRGRAPAGGPGGSEHPSAQPFSRRSRRASRPSRSSRWRRSWAPASHRRYPSWSRSRT